MKPLKLSWKELQNPRIKIKLERNEDDEMNLTRLQASPQQSVTESMWDSFTWPPEDSKPESVPGSPVVTSSPRQMKSIIDWMSSASPPSPPPAFVPETAPDLRDWNVLAYHPALVCRKCQHRVEIGWDHNIEVYKTTTYPCNLHKMIPLNWTKLNARDIIRI